jgi:nitroimidazol reductase NimA-like FMN-containing flavoprotein (pyridoxamine 5'-phosphate oxidase superfamily)
LTRHAKALVEELNETECRRLITPGGIGRIAYHGRYDLTVLPVNYRFIDGAIVFRTGLGSPTSEDLRTGIAHADYKVAFEIDHLDEKAREGWSVLVQGPAHHLDSDEERVAGLAAEVMPWAGGEKEDFIRITPTRMTGRRIRQPL